MATSSDKAKAAEKIIIGGLFLQLLFLSFFIATAALFHCRMNMVPTAKSERPEVRWKRYLAVVYTASALILVRSVFRVIEYLQGHNGYLLTTEAFLYVFDAVLMFLVVAMLNWWHPSEVAVLLREESEELGDVEMVGVHVGQDKRRKRRMRNEESV